MERFNIVKIPILSRGIYIASVIPIKTLSSCRFCPVDSKVYIKDQGGASLVAQWLRIGLPIQGTWVRALIWEDPTCRGATKLVRHN